MEYINPNGLPVTIVNEREFIVRADGDSEMYKVVRSRVLADRLDITDLYCDRIL